MEKLKKIVDDLKGSPTFTMSLAGKELFHSNFWAWILEHKDFGAEFITVFFPEIEKTSYEVKRENNHTDISIKIGTDKIYVIENKLKSIAKHKQLERYEKNFGDAFKGGVLTGISKDITFEKDSKWKFVSYEEIAKKLKEIAPKDDSLEAKLINQYAEDISDISKLFKLLSQQENSNALPDPKSKICELLQEIRFADVYKKSNITNLSMISAMTAA